ncbi:hypothetical protein AHAS_Ahas03G0226100 [Arachis hypogaea]
MLLVTLPMAAIPRVLTSILLTNTMELLAIITVMLVIWVTFLQALMIPLSGVHSILGRAVVVHADPDEIRRDAYSVKPNILVALNTAFETLEIEMPACGHELSKTTGNAGARVEYGNTSDL